MVIRAIHHHYRMFYPYGRSVRVDSLFGPCRESVTELSTESTPLSPNFLYLYSSECATLRWSINVYYVIKLITSRRSSLSRTYLPQRLLRYVLIISLDPQNPRSRITLILKRTFIYCTKPSALTEFDFVFLVQTVQNKIIGVCFDNCRTGKKGDG